MNAINEKMKNSFQDHFLGGENIDTGEVNTKNNWFRVIEWTAPSFVFVAIICHAFDLYPIGPAIHLIGATLWVYVGLKKKAGPILLNFVPQIPVWASGLIYWFVSR